MNKAFYRKRSTFFLLLSALLGFTGIASSVASATTITVINLDSPGEGFNDSTPAVPVGENPGTTVGEQRFDAFQHAANIWAGLISSSVEIRVGARFDPLTCDATTAILGSAGPTQVNRNFAGAIVANTWYPVALANALHGSDLSTSSSDITATFNSSIGTTCAFPLGWYYGLDGNPGSDIDFVSVVLHELGHGLGFLTFVDLTTGAKLSGSDDTFMRNLERHGASPPDYPSMSDSERVAASTDTGNLHWVGSAVRAASGILTAGTVGDHVRMYAPNPARAGSSVAHWDTALTPNQVMEPSYTGPIHDPVLELPLLEDIGWTVVNCESSVNPTSASYPAAGGTGGVAVTAPAGCAWTATSNVGWITITNATNGSGNGTVTYSVAANAGAARSGTLTIAGQAFTVQQAGAGGCNSAVAPGCALTNGVAVSNLTGAQGSQQFYYLDLPPGTSSLAVQTSAGSGDVDLYVRFGAVPTTSAYTCRPYVNGNNETCSFTNPAAGRWYIMLRGFTAYSGVTLNAQYATGSCTYSLNSTSASYPAAGGTGGVAVTAPADCAWTATSNVGWITITNATNGSGNDTVTYSVAANAGAARSGTLTIAGQAFTVQQAGVGGCNSAVAPGCALTNGVAVSNLTGAQGSQQFYYLDLPAGTSSLAVQTSAGSGDVDLYVRFGAAPTTSAYTCRPYVNGNNETCSFTNPAAGRWYIMLRGFTAYSGVTLKAQYATGSCTYSLNSTSASYPAAGGTGGVAVTAPADCAWTATSNVGWITITNATNGSGNDTVTYSVAANAGAARSGTLTIAGQAFTVQQAGVGGCNSAVAPGCSLTNGVAVSNLTGAQGSQQFYYLDLPAGTSSLAVQTSAGSGDVDLYVRFGAAPTTSAYTCRPYVNGNNETCSFTNPAAGRWYIMLRGFTAYSGVTLKAQY